MRFYARSRFYAGLWFSRVGGGVHFILVSTFAPHRLGFARSDHSGWIRGQYAARDRYTECLMGRFGRFVFMPLASFCAFSGPLAVGVLAGQDGLRLEQGDIFTNDVGTVMGVTVTNDTPQTISSVSVTCAFTANGAPAGSAGTQIFNIVAGAKGDGQVHLLGPKASAATCSIGGTTPPAP